MKRVNGDPRLRAFDAETLRNMKIRGFDAGAVTSGMIFLEAENEKVERKVLEPLAAVTWQRDIFTDVGGGWVDGTSHFFADYGNSDMTQLGLVGTETTEISRVQGEINKVVYPVFNWEVTSDIKYIDLEKTKGAGRSLQDLYSKGVILKWNKTIDHIVYIGTPVSISLPGGTGMMNNPSVTASLAPVGAAASSRWALKTPQEILADINFVLVQTVVQSAYDVSGMADTILIPWTQYGILQQPITLAGCNSIEEYVLANNIAKRNGIELKILPVGWASGQGSGGTDLLTAYRNDRERVKFDITVPMQQVQTTFSVPRAAYETLWAGQIGVVKFLFPQSAYYLFGI
jgi:hypothetical protein